MAWLNGKWLTTKERTELIGTYTEYLDLLDAEHGSFDGMPSDVQADYYEKVIELERLERIQRCEGNLLEFSIEYFSDARNEGNDGNWEGFDVADIAEAPDFHREIADIINDVSNVNTNAKVAVAAPRSHAKSTYLSKAFPMHEVVFRRRKYMIIISETPSVSTANMEWIRNQLKYNEKLRADFGPLLSPKDQANITDKSDAFIAWHPDGDRRRQLTLVEAASTGQALRGRNWNGSRPDGIIMDDLEDARPGGNASTPEQRSKLRDWFSQTVMPLGDPKGKRTAFVYMGTTVHISALLMHVLYSRSDFETRVYRAIIDFPERMDLWEEMRLIYVERENSNRRNDALAFYEANKDELLRGARVLWPDVQPLLKLMMWKWDNSSKAFNTEYMNNPIDEESMIFNPETFTYYTADASSFSHAEYILTMGIDFAMGKKERGDYSAITVVAKHKISGAIFIIDSYGERAKPDVFIKAIVQRVLTFEPDILAVEANMAQEFFADTLIGELASVGYPAFTRVKKIFNRSRKELRIEALLPEIENGTIRFSKKHTLLLEQFERYGQGEHDDLPDSLEMAVSAQKSGNVEVRTVRRSNRW